MKSDGELMADFKHGDRAAFQKLFRRHHIALLNFFYTLIGDRATAEDLTERVFVRLFGERDQIQLQPSFKFSIYLYRLGYVFWLGHRRRLAESPLTPRSESTADAAILALQQLSDEHKPVIVLCEMSGLSYSEIARVLDVSEGEVKLRMNAAYTELRNYLLPKALPHSGAQA